MKHRSLLLSGVPIVLFWLTMALLLWSREQPANSSPSNASGPLDQSYVLWTTERQPAGTLRLQRQPQSRNGLPGQEITLTSQLQLSLLGQASGLGLNGTLWRAELPHEQAEFTFAVEASGQSTRLEGVLQNGELRAELVSAGERLPLSIPVGERLRLSTWTGGLLELPSLEPGQRARVQSFDPLSLGSGRMLIRCLRRETLRLGSESYPARLLMVEGIGMSTRVWIDDAGEVLRAETPLGLMLERAGDQEPPTVAEIAQRNSSDLLAATAIRPAGLRPQRGARRLRVQLSGPVESMTDPPKGPTASRRVVGVDSTGAGAAEPQPGDLPAGGGQRRLADGSWELVRLGPEGAPDGWPTSAGTQEADLLPEPLVQSDHPAIQEQASALVQGVDGPWPRALAIHDWVYTQLEKVPAPGIPSALEVLARKRGDCNEHTVLFTALARAAGLPTRIAVGVVWSDELEGFYYHAWPEVWIGHWQAMDPTLGQQRADATHLKLVQGGIAQWPRLLAHLGRLSIEVLEMEMDKNNAVGSVGAGRDRRPPVISPNDRPGDGRAQSAVGLGGLQAQAVPTHMEGR